MTHKTITKLDVAFYLWTSLTSRVWSSRSLLGSRLSQMRFWLALTATPLQTQREHRTSRIWKRKGTGSQTYNCLVNVKQQVEIKCIQRAVADKVLFRLIPCELQPPASRTKAALMINSVYEDALSCLGKFTAWMLWGWGIWTPHVNRMVFYMRCWNVFVVLHRNVAAHGKGNDTVFQAPT